MLKRTNKLTALLAAAASVAALAPAGAMAADYKRIDSQDATVYGAVAFKDGSYVIDGNVVDEDTDAVYYVKDGKYTELEDVDTGADLELYGDHYLNVDNGDYFIDLNTGKVTDDDVKADDHDDLQIALKKALKNVNRYNVGDSNNSLPDVDTIPGPNYGDVWYSVSNLSYDDTNLNDNSIPCVYSDVDGNYIDANYNLGRIRVETTSAATGNSSKVTNVTNSEDKEDGIKDSEVTAEVVYNDAKDVKILGQDSNNIYRLATIRVTAKASKEAEKVSITNINGIDVPESGESDVFKVVSNNGDTAVVEFQVVQKISKTQSSDEIDDAKYAKSVSNYMLTNKDRKVKGNVSTFKAMLNDKDSNVEYTIADGRLVAYKKDKDDSDKLFVMSTGFKSKGSLNYLDVEDSVSKDAKLFTTGADGNLYRLEDGYIYKFDNTDNWDKIYRIDGSMDNLSVYDKNNMVAWNQDNEVYSVIGSKASNSDEDNNNTEDNTDNNTNTTTAGWNQAANGTWTYVNADGTTVKGWFQSPLSGKWYFMNTTTGVMETGWVQSPYSGQWFYMDPSNGNMVTGWVQSPYSGKWYFMNLTNGNMETGWVQSPYSGKWYYMDANGAMVTNTTVGGYALGADGAWIR